MAKKRKKRKSTRKTTRRRKKPRKKSRGRRSGSLPKNPKKGQTASIVRRGRKITFKYRGTKKLPWRIVSNVPA